jgi:RNA polymerase sigma factor for flagellar operon FliA
LSDTLSGVATIFITSLEGAEMQLSDDRPAAEERLIDAQMGTLIRQAIAALPDKERQLLEMHYFGGKNLQDAGKALGLSKSWASRLHARAVDLLRREVERLQSGRQARAGSGKRGGAGRRAEPPP